MDGRDRKKDLRRELQALVGLVVALGLFLLGARWLVAHQKPAVATDSASTMVGGAAHDPNDKVMIVVNGEPIYESELNAAMGSLPAQMRQQAEANPEGRRELAEELVKMKILEQQARRMGIDKQPGVGGQVSVVQANVLANLALQQLVQQTPPPTLEQLYAQNRGRLETAQVKSILIPYEGSRARPRSGTPLSVEAATAKANDVAARLRKGENFDRVAAAESAGQPNLGEVRRGTIPPELERVIFSVPVGQISDPVRSSFGIHIFLVTDRKAPSLEQVRPALEREAQNLHAAAIVDDLRKRANVEFKF